MKTLAKLSFLIVITCHIMSCSESVIYDQSSEPHLKSANVLTPNIVGSMDLILSPTSLTNLWNGTIDFGDYGEYSIAFFTLTPPPVNFEGVYLFDEDFIVYKGTGLDWEVTENVVLKGSHKGRLVFANTFPESVKLDANGKITEAHAPFEKCMGRTVHAKGTVFFTSVPAPTAVLEMRIN